MTLREFVIYLIHRQRPHSGGTYQWTCLLIDLENCSPTALESAMIPPHAVVVFFGRADDKKPIPMRFISDTFPTFGCPVPDLPMRDLADLTLIKFAVELDVHTEGLSRLHILSNDHIFQTLAALMPLCDHTTPLMRKAR